MVDTLDQLDTLDTIKGQPYIEGFVHNNVTETTITTQDVPHAIKLMAQGHSQNGLTFTAGINGTTSAFADYSGTVAGTVKATDTTHGLTTGDVI